MTDKDPAEVAAETDDRVMVLCFGPLQHEVKTDRFPADHKVVMSVLANNEEIDVAPKKLFLDMWTLTIYRSL